jgi:hypothetical protein
VTAQPLHYLVEAAAYDPSRSNLLGYPRELSNAWWAKAAASVTANAAASHDGLTLADKLVENSASAEHILERLSITTPTNIPHAFSVFAKADTRSQLRMALYSAGAADLLRAHFDLSAGTVISTNVTGTATVLDAYIQPYGNGWWRCVLIGTPKTTDAGSLYSARLQLLNAGSLTYTGDGTSGLLLDRALLEAGQSLGEPIDNAGAPGPGVRVLRFASAPGKTTGAADTPPHVHFEPRVMQPVDFKRSMFSAARVTGGASVGAGDIVLNNTDQGLAGLRDLGLDGRDVVVRVGPQDAAYPGGYTTFLTGTAEQVEVGARTATIRLRDRLQLLSQPLQATLYAGTNSLPSGAEGTADDIKGREKPLLFGIRQQIEPVLVNTSKLIWQFHDGTAEAVDGVYDQGVALTPSGTDRANLAALEAATIAAGQYDTCLALGLVRLGSAPSGRITIDAGGDASGGYVETAAGIVERILTQRCGIAAGDIDSASFSALASAAPAAIGAYFTGQVTRQAAIDSVLASVGAWCAPARAGLWQVGRLVAPSGSPDFTFTDVEILALDALPTRDEGRGLPVWRVKLRYRPFAGLSRSDLAGAVTEARKAELLAPWREVSATDTSVQAAHPLAVELVRETLLDSATDAQAEADRLLAMHSPRRDFVQATVWLTQANAAVELGKKVRLVTPRLGYTAGRDFIVTGIALNGRRQRLTLDLWG